MLFVSQKVFGHGFMVALTAYIHIQLCGEYFTIFIYF
jgi:hypothetical protein